VPEGCCAVNCETWATNASGQVVPVTDDYHIVLIGFQGDGPMLNKFAGFLGVGATLGCGNCLIKGSKTGRGGMTDTILS